MIQKVINAPLRQVTSGIISSQSVNRRIAYSSIFHTLTDMFSSNLQIQGLITFCNTSNNINHNSVIKEKVREEIHIIGILYSKIPEQGN